MLEVIEPKQSQRRSTEWKAIVSRVCGRIPPLWDLSNYVAVNPFVGYSQEFWVQAARDIADGLGAQFLPPMKFYQNRWAQGAFGHVELADAAKRMGKHYQPLEDILNGVTEVASRSPGGTLSLAELHDRAYGTHWHESVIRSIARWCAVYCESGGRFWNRPTRDKGLYRSWREAAAVDRTLEIAGLAGWRKWVARLPDSSTAAIELILLHLGMDQEDLECYFYRLLGGLYGWASFFRRSSWQSGVDAYGPLADLLAIRLCADAAVAELAPKAPARPISQQAANIEDETLRAVLQEALEDGFVRNLIEKIQPPLEPLLKERPSVQAVFCIDVRSEPFRRQLEGQSPTIETLGFAGFFGVALDWKVGNSQSARCPVLLNPSISVCATDAKPLKTLAPAFKHMQAAPAAAFSFVETLGMAYGIGLAKDALKSRSPKAGFDNDAQFVLGADDSDGVALEVKLDVAASILINSGLRSRLARLVLFCGHESLTTNNPHAASLDCGACGGHGGAINARVAVSLLNDEAVRSGLKDRGINVPTDTWFIPGVHNTTTDQVSLLDTARVPASHAADLASLKTWLDRAGEMNRKARAASLGLATEPAKKLESRIFRRACDGSQVRPEWGLAKNAAFIAARRQRTRGVDLQGRSFLHEYDWRNDPDSSILTLILCAPMVVASWINLQYFASTVDNRMFGCGNKALHNRIGSLGVVLGNGGDLRTGLAVQSVHAADGSWYHEPLRLQVIVEAPTDRIDQVLKAKAGVRDLVENGWVRLFALNPDGRQVSRWVAPMEWEIVQPQSSDSRAG